MARILVYRISSGGYAKEKPSYITKESCFVNMLRELVVLAAEPTPVQLIIVADKCTPALLAFIRKSVKVIAATVPTRLIETSIGHGAGSFVAAVNHVVNDKTICLDDVVYFLEDDYLHVPRSLAKIFGIIESGRADYATGYDHPDKYGTFDAETKTYKSVNPFVDHTTGSEMATDVIFHEGHHWKHTHSTTMTFATKVRTIKSDFDECIGPFVGGRHPEDFDIWTALELVAKRRLVSPLPSLSTHGETAWLAKAISWDLIGTKDLASAVKMKSVETDD
jgi:hypothetical protein